ncbi:IclR family transcriptional regulator [Paenarthrobacter aromaticivorans]|uniref:IclR family transcriptional regulator n=1 Tax=Paenarthrobacter aromaticivorans TaxID=2849150 RepID=A0ABS6I1B3_9MICC|nr:IclR family transcriptional regulator [Paenarthrobacter sp. MMS21-TAE1-1]MBU8864819.1 IclR family transcriptional regulator [Paenarthrobacter sp. MMS21-TAE1-1]
MAAKPIKVLANSAELLNVLADNGPLGIADIAVAISMPRPSVYRLLDALGRVGLVGMRDDGRAQLGTQVLHLADAALREIPEARAARAEMLRLNDVTGQTVYLCALRGQTIACLDWVKGTRVALMQLNPGGHLPPHAGASSRAILAWNESLRWDVTSAAPLEKLTDHTLVSADELEADAATTRSRGYSVSDEDVTIGVAAVGAPLFDARGNLRGAISIAGLRDSIIPYEHEYGSLLLQAAANISEAVDAIS